MTRKKAREEAFKLIFQIESLDECPNEVWDKYFQSEDCLAEGFPKGKSKAYMLEVVEGVFKHLEQIDRLIKQNIIKIDFSRLAKVNLAIMRLSIYEMLYMDDIPASVSINEAVELSKIYDSPESSSFVNGTLGAIQKNISAP